MQHALKLNTDVTPRYGARRWHGFLIIALLAILCEGCGGSNSLIPVHGEVTYQGKPLEYGTINFVSPNSRLASGEIEEGKFVNVTTYQKNDGLAPGEYFVTISVLDRSEKYRNTMVPPSLIPRKYADFNTSGLTAIIERGKTNELRFELK